MIRLFCGYDYREAIGLSVFIQSVLAHASEPVAVTPLSDLGVGGGSNAFTASRFLIPFLCSYEGWAIFVDGSDMVVQDDIYRLLFLADARYAVQVVKHDYKTRHALKYRFSEMECPNLDYPRKNWASVMLINCGHPQWQKVTPEFVVSRPQRDLLQFKHLTDEAIGEIPPRWNVLVDEGQAHDNAAILHWTAGIPAFPHYKDSPCADVWREYRNQLERHL